MPSLPPQCVSIQFLVSCGHQTLIAKHSKPDQAVPGFRYSVRNNRRDEHCHGKRCREGEVYDDGAQVQAQELQHVELQQDLNS